MNDIDILDWFTDTEFFGVSMANMALALAVAVVVYIALTLALRLALGRLRAVSSHTGTHADDVFVEVLSGTNRFLLALVALLIGVGMLDLPDRWASRVSQLWFVALALQLALWANRTVTVFLRRHAARHGTPGVQTVSAATTLISWGVRTLLWAIVLLAMLSNMGVNITAFIASLGVGGIAVALAAQSLLGDLFASVAIAVDKPFEVGDFIVFGSVAGTVETVGVKTTRIRALGGEQVVMSNTELLKQTVSNYKRLRERRIVFGFGVTYATSPDQAAAIPELVKRIVEESGKLRFDRAHLKAFGESSLDYEVVYIVLDPDFGLYMNEQQRINLSLMRELDAMGVGFAFPTRTVVLDASTPLRFSQVPAEAAAG
ncbi:mechanosensitive ion channel family protein [Rhizobacter sp. LjRoot28]|uniref:mechanosensitive ion channel family protein n=1 Tax=Rhizobacter sp. LjRoot28 TaxID=3342309 RepID=UPI003ECC4880